MAGGATCVGGVTAVSQTHAACVHSVSGDLAVCSGGDLFVSLAGAPTALTVSTTAVPGGDVATRIESSSRMALRTPETFASARALRLGSDADLGVSVGAFDGGPAASSSVARWTREGMFAAVRAADGVAESRIAARAAAGGAITCAAEAGTHTLVRASGDGTCEYRSRGHAFDVAGRRVLSVDDGSFVVHADLAVEGVLNSITGIASDLRVADSVVEVGTDLDTEADVVADVVASGQSGGCGLVIETAPGDVAHVGAFESATGGRLFVTVAGDGDGSDAATVDASRAVRSGAFAKRLDHHANGGARQLGRSDRASRAHEPFWDARGGALRITKFAAAPDRVGHVMRYVVTLRAASDGTLEVSRYTATLRHARGGGALEAVGDEVFCPLMACEP